MGGRAVDCGGLEIKFECCGAKAHNRSIPNSAKILALLHKRKPYGEDVGYGH